jgi:hypothetical protein
MLAELIGYRYYGVGVPVPCQEMDAGGNPMAWFYEIRYSKNAVAETGKGFATQEAAIAAGRKRARELNASGSLSSGRVGTVGAQHDSEEPTR